MTCLVLVLASCTSSAGAQEAGEEGGGGFFGFGGDQGDEGDGGEEAADDGAEGDDAAADDGAGDDPAADDGAGDDGAADDGAADDGAGDDPAADDGTGDDGAADDGAADDGAEGDDAADAGDDAQADDPEAEADEANEIFSMRRGGRGPRNRGQDPPRENPDEDADPDPDEQAPEDPCDPQGLPLHDGTQTSEVGGAVCSANAVGVIPGPDNTPQNRIVTPANGDTLAVGEDFDITMAFANFEPGLFDDPATQYGVNPVSIDGNGNIRGHSHVYVQQLNGDDVPSTTLDSFLALNEPSADGVTLSGTVPGVDEAGTYRICTDIAAGNHFPAIRGVAQNGGPMDCINVEFA